MTNTPQTPAMTPDEQTAWDKFAAAALTGLVASNLYDRNKGKVGEMPIAHLAAAIAAEYADQMMVVREIREKKS